MYKCERCGYLTEYKSNLKTHFNRKKPCKPFLKDISIETLKLKINQKLIKKGKINEINDDVNILSTENDSFFNEMSTSVNQMSTSVSHNVNPLSTSVNALSTSINLDVNKKLYFCKYCKKKFKYRQSKSRHEKNCKYKTVVTCIDNNNNLSEQDYIESLKNQIVELCKEKEEYRKKMDKKFDEIHKEKMNLIDKVGNNIQININSYGNENINYITQDVIKNLIKAPFGAVPKLIKHIHCNPNHPENHNVKITNKKMKLISVKRENKWEFMDKNDLLEDIVDKGYNILDTEYDNIDLSNKESERYERFKDKYINGDKKLSKSLKRATELNILNNTSV